MFHVKLRAGVMTCFLQTLHLLYYYTHSVKIEYVILLRSTLWDRVTLANFIMKWIKNNLCNFSGNACMSV